MEHYPESIRYLIEAFSHLPTIGRKSAQRLAMNIVSKDKEEVDQLIQALIDVKTKIVYCEICNNLSDKEICQICSNINRDKELVCIVEDVPSLIAIEKSGAFNGRYHVLGGLLNPMEGIGPKDLDLDKLSKRIVEDDIKELVLAISPTVEGEMTANFIQDLLAETDVILSRIASGIPIGASLEYFDDMTLIRALEERRSMDK